MRKQPIKRGIFVLFMFCAFFSPAWAARWMENLDRGVVAVSQGGSQVYIGWRLLGTEPDTIAFNVYRNGVKINASPITGSTNYVDTGGSLAGTYQVAAVIDGSETDLSDPVAVWSQPYLTVPLQVPAGGTTPDGVSYTYSPNDASVGDLDGDGQYEIILKWDPSNSQDNSDSGYTGNVYLDAYELDGTFLWRIDLGINIRAGAHYTQFIVYDLDSDGIAEVACKTAPYTKDGLGSYVLLPGDTLADYRNSSGYILDGPEYLTVFDGLTGEALATTDYYPDRVNVSQWGDTYGNRVDRFLAGVAYLDGERPSIIMARGYYGPQSGLAARNEITAWNWREGELTQVWWFKAGLNINDNINSDYIGQGCHSLSIADVDSDGFDEIVYGACAIDHDGSPLYNTGLGHGDALHVSDFDPSRPGLEVWQCHEGSASGASFRDAADGTLLFEYENTGDVGRACAGDITASYPGAELWASSGCPLYSADGTNLGSHSLPINFMVWWDGDLLRELLDGITISKYGASTQLYASGCSSNNGSKSNPCLSADILGDWREEVIFRTTDNTALRIYTTTALTSHRIYTLMHDPQYRLSIAWQNGAYNQPPHPSFFLGDGMSPPPVPDIQLVGVEPGGLLREWWLGVAGGAVSYLTSLPDYPNNPSGRSILSRMQGPTDWADEYGVRLRGWLIPPQDGSYTFWTAADDSAELWLSTDALPANASLIASVSARTNPLQWNKYPQQQSAPINLRAGHKYYIELLHKENTGDDHFAVAWQGPGLSQQVIEAHYLMPWTDIDYGELSGNRYVDLTDLAILCGAWLSQGCDLGLDIDYTGDCIVSFPDFAVFAAHWLTGTPYEMGTLVIQENEPGFVGVFNGWIDNKHAGYTGTGFVDTENAAGQYIEWTFEAPEAGTYDLQWRYANGASANRTATVSINGAVQATGVGFPATGDWAAWTLSPVVPVSMNQGFTTIRLIAEVSGQGLANIDRISITGLMYR